MDANIQPDFLNDDFTKPKPISYWGQLGILLGLIIGGAIVAAFVQLIIFLTMTDFKTLMSGNADKLMDVMTNPANVSKVMLMQVLGTLVLMAIPAFAFARIVNKQPIQYLGLNHKINFTQVGLVVAIAFVGLILSGALGELNQMIPISHKLKLKFDKMEADYAKQIMIFSNMKTIGDYLVSMILVAVLPAIFEELLFRGAIQKLFVNWFKEPHFAIFFTAFWFSIIHFSWYGFLPRMMLGAVLGYLFYYGKSLWLNILMHFINNGIAITAMYFALKNGQDAAKTMNDTFPLWLGAIALVMMIGLLIVYKRVCEKNNTTLNQFSNSTINF